MQKSSRTSLSRLMLLGLVSSAPLSMHAQFENGSIVGSVRDAAGALVPGAAVSVVNEATGVEISRESDKAGEYQVPSLRPGKYRITVDEAGFSLNVQNDVVVSVGTPRRVDIALAAGSSSERVEVEATALQLDTDNSQRSQIITAKQIQAFPLPTLEYSDLVRLSTGVIESSIGVNTGSSSLVRTGSFNVNGQRSMFNNFLLDGMDNNAHGTSNQGFSNEIVSPPPDSLSQFQLIVDNPSAEYGRASGATINVAYASGTNRYHGEVYEYLRNTVLNAKGYFTPAGNAKPVFLRNQFGGNVGGFLIRDKAFFFGDFEASRQRRTAYNASSIFRTTDHALTFSSTIYNPFTGVAYPANIPISRAVFSAAALRILDAAPLPNVAGVPANVAANNYAVNQRFSSNEARYNIRLDYQINPRQSVFTRLSQSKILAIDFPFIPEPLDGGTNGSQYVLNQQLALGYTRQLGANQLVEGRLGVSYTKGSKSTLAVGDPNTYGIPNLPVDPRVRGGIPTMVISGYSTFGRQPTNPQWQYPFLLNPKVSYSNLRGSHSFKLGYEYQQVRETVQDSYPLYGQFTFAGNYSGSAVTDFLFGAPSLLNQTSFYVAHLRQVAHFGYLQDDWHLSPRVTLNLGMRYEYGSPYWDKDNRLNNFDPLTSPATGTLLSARAGNTYDRSLVQPDRNDLGPRFGFSYAASAGTVVRGGFGMSYIHYSRNGEENVLSINAPQTIIGALSQVAPYTAGKKNATASSTYYRIDQGFPATLTNAANYTPSSTVIKYVARNFRDPYVESYYLGVQQALGKNRLIDVDYVGNHSLKLEETGNFNQANVALGRSSAGTFIKPYPTFNDIIYTFNGGGANYNGAQVRFEQRDLAGLTILESFTWSRTFDFASANAEQAFGNGSGPQDIYNQRADYGPSQYDHPIINVLSVVYDLPAGRGKRYLSHSNGLVNALLGGWTLTGVDSEHSGNPWTPQYTPAAVDQVSALSHTTSSNNGANNYRPNRIPGVPINIRSDANGFPIRVNTAAFSIPVSKGATPFGNAARNPFRGDFFFQLDAGVNKTFALPWEGSGVQFRMQGYNVLNKTNFQPAGSNAGSTTTFGQVTATYLPRIVQFALKANF